MKNKGFTLSELLVALVIISIISILIYSFGFSNFRILKGKITNLNRESIKEAANLVATEIIYCKYEDSIKDELNKHFGLNETCGYYINKYENEGLTFNLKYLQDKNYLKTNCEGTVTIKYDYNSNDALVTNENYTCE